jgi:hypothetical protein
MTQALYAHMNNKKIIKKTYSKKLEHVCKGMEVMVRAVGMFGEW